MATTTLNIYQAARKLRLDYAHTDITTAHCGDNYRNLYFIMHDALHTYLNCPPEFEHEDQVLATEHILGGRDASQFESTPEVLSNGLASIPTEALEIFIDFYTNWFNQ